MAGSQFVGGYNFLGVQKIKKALASIIHKYKPRRGKGKDLLESHERHETHEK